MSDIQGFSHISGNGRARMVDVGHKRPSDRMARAEATVHLGEIVAKMLRQTGAVAKGNIVETARIGGIMAAKRTPDLIPMCHPIPLDVVDIDMELIGNDLKIEATVRARALTGVEMEAMTAVSLAALIVYDMCKSAGKGITIGAVRLLEKTGGKSGQWRAKARDNGQS